MIILAGWSSFPQGKEFCIRYRVQAASGAHPAFCPVGSGDSARSWSDQAMKLATHRHPVLRLIHSDLLPPSLCYVGWCYLTKRKENFFSTYSVRRANVDIAVGSGAV
jgi:hypothetical protein